MMQQMKKGCLSIIGVLILWQLIISIGNINSALFPSVFQVIEAFVELLRSGLKGSTSNLPLLSHISVSLIRFLIGYLIASFLGVILGLVLGSFPNVFAYVNPIVQLLRPIAPVAWMPFIVLWFGIGSVPAIVIIFIAGFFPVLLSTVSAIQNLDPIYEKIAQTFGYNKLRFMFQIALPASSAQIINSLRLALGTSWIFLVSGEMVGSQSGLGFLVMDSKNCLRPDALLAIILVIGVIGLLLDTLIRLVEGEILCKSK